MEKCTPVINETESRKKKRVGRAPSPFSREKKKKKKRGKKKSRWREKKDPAGGKSLC